MRHSQFGALDWLQDFKEIDKVLFFFVREANLEAAVVEVHELGQIGGGTIGEVGRASDESPELLHQDRTSIRAFSGDERAAGVLSQKGAAELRMRRGRRVARNAEERHLG